MREKLLFCCGADMFGVVEHRHRRPRSLGVRTAPSIVGVLPADGRVARTVVTAIPEALQERLKQAALRDYDLDLEIASDCFALDQEQWQKVDKQEKRTVPSGRKEAKSTSQRSIRR
jgi:hypothetical protein